MSALTTELTERNLMTMHFFIPAKVFLWDTQEMKFLRTIEFEVYREVYRDVKCKCDFSPDGAMLVTALSCCHIFIYDVHTGQNLSHLR